MKLLTIVVPIYNVEPYLERCLRSLQAQDIPKDNYEIICINDGSTDNSQEIVKRLQYEFQNIILIEQYNQGVSSARNTGIDKSNGQYLLFVDPDDFIQENCLAQILKTVVLYSVEIAICGYVYLDSYGKIEGTRTYDLYEGKVMQGIDMYFLTHQKGQNQADSSVGIIYEKDFLNKNNLRFLPNVPYLEDGEFVARVHCLANRCIFIQETLYINIKRIDSATRSNLFSTEKARTGFQLAAVNLKLFQNRQYLTTRQNKLLNNSIAQFVFLAILSALKTKSINNLRAIFKSLKESGLEKLNLKHCSGYYRICGKSYNVSPYLGIIMFAFYLRFENWYQSYLFKK